MSKTKFVQASDSWTQQAVKFLVVVTLRFFLGKPMNGKRIDNSSFLHGATKTRIGAKKKVLSRWQKKPWIHRAMIRGVVFWPIVGLVALAIWNRLLALSVTACLCIALAYPAYRKGRLIFFDPYSYTDAENGARIQCWGLKPYWRKLFRSQPIPGLVTRKTRYDDTLPHELQEAVRRMQPKNETPMLGTIKRYRRDRKVKEVTK